MMLRKLYLTTLVTLAALAPLAAAQTSTTTSTFDSLSPGNQKIAEALFNAQQPTANGPAPLDLNQITSLKTGTGWGVVFQNMKSEGLISARNLGQVVSGYEHTLTHSATLGAGNSGGALTVTTGMGHASSQGSGHVNGLGADMHGNAGGGHGGTTITTAGGSSMASAGAINAGGNGLHTGAGIGGGHGH